MPGSALPLETFEKFFHKCLTDRVPVDTFEAFFNQLLARSPLSPTVIASLLLGPSLTCNVSDPIHLQYIGRLVEKDVVSISNILDALLKFSPAKPNTVSNAHANQDPTFFQSGDDLRGRESLEQDVFLVLTGILHMHKPYSSDRVWATVQAMNEWMEAVMAVSGAGMMGDGGDGLAEAAMAADVPAKGRIEALGGMVIALGVNEQASKVLSESPKNEKKLAFQSCLALFAHHVHLHDPALASRLEGLRQQYLSQQSPKSQRRGLKSEAEMDGIIMGMGDGSDSMPQPAGARAHLFVWLEGLLCGCPHVDDETILGYLYSRYKDDTSSMAMDFLTAVIDVITNALVRNETSSTLFLLRSFLCNKVPLILNRISPSSLTSSYAITQTFLRTDMGTLMSLVPSQFEPYAYNSNASPDMIYNDITLDLRPDFLFACALHGVIGEQDIQGILGELPLGAMSASGRYNYRELQTQCIADPNRVERLLEEIESVEGNSGAVVMALFEIMKSMCESRETMPLRSICSYLARKPSSIDVMLLFIKPAEILEPLCDLLDTWRYEEDQGEYQPVYEEFGYILLLVLTFVFRYSFTSSDLAFSHQPNNEAFVPQLLYEFSTAHRIEALNSSEFHGQLGGWIKELFEGEGISDGLMSSCRPQEFYRIVPTLFSQSMLAIQRGILDLDTVKEAFAFLLTPFLLPSVISGLSWLSQHLWANLDDPYHTLQILSSLIIAQDLAPETAETHRTVVSISARRLDATLRELLRRPNISRDTVRTAQQLLNYLKPHLAFKRNGSPARNEIDSWVHNAGSGGLSTALANLYSVMFLWSLPGDMAQVRPQTSAYTHRLIMSTWKLLGAYRVVEVIINETVKARLSQQAPPGIAEDVAAAFVGVYLPFEKGGPWTLKEALRSMDLFEEDPGRAEVVADVLRRVEALGRPWVPADHGGVGMEDAAAHHHVDLGSMGLGPEDGMDLMMGGEDFGSGLGMLDAMEM